MPLINGTSTSPFPLKLFFSTASASSFSVVRSGTWTPISCDRSGQHRALLLPFRFTAAHAYGRAGEALMSGALLHVGFDVLAWAAEGKSAWETGEILGIAKRTVDEHVQSASRKLNAVNRAQAVVAALRERFISV